MTILRFRDDQTNELREIDLSAGVMLSHGADGRVQESRVVEHDEYAKSLARFASEYDRNVGARQRGSHLMDLGVGDVHQAAPLTNYAAGYRNEAGVAEIVSPVIMTAKPSAKYYTWDKDDAFQDVDNVEAAPGAAFGEVSPRLSNATFSTTQYALGGFVPTEIQAAADAPLQPMQNTVRRVVNVLHIAREKRIAALLGTAGSYASAQKVDLSGDATKKWNGGANSDPVANLHAIIEAALMEPTGIVMNRQMYNAFVRNAAVQKYIAFKSGTKPMPTPGDISALLELPPIYVAKMKAKSKTAGTYGYIWGNDCVLFHAPQQQPPLDGQDISSAYTFRWLGDGTSDGQITDGWLIRTFYDQKRGPQGGMQVVAVHQDADILTSPLVGGMVIGALQ